MSTTSTSIDPVTDKRFELVRPLGEGASGAVMLALDRETHEHVALKRLFNLDQKSVQRFKREFRALSDIHHPNLVKLYDLHRGQDAWFITMEYVAGQDFRQKFGADMALESDALEVANDNAQRDLLRIFYDLACGINAIHRAGMLHRDLKPSNALVADDGRVVVLDYGLVREIEGDQQLTYDGTIAGTPAYMAPEQASGEKLSEASDWYAFGVMLYEAISGVLPIDGKNLVTLMKRKLNEDPDPLQAGAPSEVLDLCNRLLSRKPDRRPQGSEVLETLAKASGASKGVVTTQDNFLTIEPAALRVASSLVGRDAEMAQLRAAIEDPRRTGSLVVHVRGASGSGKSTLVEHFLETALLDEVNSPVVLRSRCYEREAMPFKALDGVMDALVAYLARLDDVTCAYLLPSNVADLTRLFPVLERLPAVHHLRANELRRYDGTHMRRRAEQALRALLTDAAQGGRLLLWIDDMQWGDLDSARVVRGWLEEPLAAPVVIVLSYRSEEIETSASLAVLLSQPERTVREAQLTIDVEALSASDVQKLCLDRLARRTPAPAAMIERIVQEADGNPFIAQQLAAIADAKLAIHDTSLDGLSMEAVVQRATLFMGAAARDLLNVLAIAGKPLRAQLALSVAGVDAMGRAHIHTLRSLRLLRTREVGGERLLEVYHDRVREAVQSALSTEESERIHGELYKQLQWQRCDDHDWLHTLALGGGQREVAFRHGLLAAQRASDSLAFERAAELYNNCLTLFDGQTPLHELWMKFATAQAFCRRGYEAAKAYLNAAEHAPAAQRTELLQRAASHLVRSGRFEEGERIVQQVLHAQKLFVPKSQAGVLAALGWETGRIALRKIEVTHRKSTRDQEQADIALLYGVLSIETQLYAPLRSALFQARALRLALDHANAEQLARALAMSAAIISLTGTPRAAARAAELVDRAEELIKESDSQVVPIEVPCVRALCAHFCGRLNDALEPASAMVRSMEVKGAGDGLHGDYYYLFVMQFVQISALQCVGRLTDARRLMNEYIVSALATDNLAAILQVTVNRAIDEEITNMCATSRARLDVEHAQLPKSGASILSGAHMIAVMRAGCVTRDFDWAFARLDELWVPYRRSLIHRGAFLACMTHSTRAWLLLNHHVETGAAGNPGALVQADLAQLKRLPAIPITETAILRTRARVAFLQGDRARAIELLGAAIKRADDSVMRLDFANDRYALGLLIAGSEGKQLTEEARVVLTNYGVSDPEAIVRTHMPELMK